jgi:hypothetical protein
MIANFGDGPLPALIEVVKQRLGVVPPRGSGQMELRRK